MPRVNYKRSQTQINTWCIWNGDHYFESAMKQTGIYQVRPENTLGNIFLSSNTTESVRVFRRSSLK